MSKYATKTVWDIILTSLYIEKMVYVWFLVKKLTLKLESLPPHDPWQLGHTDPIPFPSDKTK